MSGDAKKGPRIEWVQISKLKNNKSQPVSRKERRQFRHLRDAVTTHGVLCPPVCGSDYTLIDGHGRVRVLQDMGEKYCWCVVQPFKSYPGALAAGNGRGVKKFSAADCMHTYLASESPDDELAEFPPSTRRRLVGLMAILGEQRMRELANSKTPLSPNAYDFSLWCTEKFAGSDPALKKIPKPALVEWVTRHEWTNNWMRKLRDNPTPMRLKRLHASISTGSPFKL